MKVFAFLVIAVASVAAKGSGPYLPSGWKPDGPAFYLPSEIVKPSANPIIDLVLDGSEASGSDSLREYGPPAILSQNVVEQNPAENPSADLDNSEASGSDFLREYGPPVLSENIINQGLPDAVTEQNFSLEFKSVVPEASVEVSPEQEAVSESAEQTTSAINIDVLIIDDKEFVESTEASPAVAQFKNVLSVENVDVSGAEAVAEAVSEAVAEAVSEAVSEAVVEAVSEVVVEAEAVAEAEAVSEAVAEVEVQTTESVSQDVTVSGAIVDSPVQNIPDIIARLENEIPSEQVEVRNLNTQAVAGSLEQAPEGFLEYGPPGFTEYGPPKEEIVSIESNAARRRRFSPKFRSSKKH